MTIEKREIDPMIGDEIAKVKEGADRGQVPEEKIPEIMEKEGGAYFENDGKLGRFFHNNIYQDGEFIPKEELPFGEHESKIFSNKDKKTKNTKAGRIAIVMNAYEEYKKKEPSEEDAIDTEEDTEE